MRDVAILADGTALLPAGMRTEHTIWVKLKRLFRMGTLGKAFTANKRVTG